MQQIPTGRTPYSWAEEYGRRSRHPGLVRLGFQSDQPRGHYFDPPKKRPRLPLQQGLYQKMYIDDNRYIHCRVTRPVWDALVLYYEARAKEGAAFAGLSASRFVRKMVPPKLRKFNGKSNR